jgi:hypothetical protein
MGGKIALKRDIKNGAEDIAALSHWFIDLSSAPLLTSAFQLRLFGLFGLFSVFGNLLIRRLLPDTTTAAIFLFTRHAHHLLSVFD